MTAYNICQSGLGICFIGDIILSRIPRNKNVVYYRLPTQHNTRRVCFYWKKGRYFSRAMEEFLNGCCRIDESFSVFTWIVECSILLNNPARRVGRGFHCNRQDFSPRAVLESRFSPALRFSWLLRHLSVLRKTGTWLLQCRPSTPTLYHTIDTHPESGNKRAMFAVTNLYCYRVTLIIDWQITHCCKLLYLFATFVIRYIRHIPYFHFSG